MNDWLKKYLERGFGSMNKNDFEVFIFSELLKSEELKSMSNFDISVRLKIPESKVKRLKYEASLRYPEKELNLKEYAKKALENVTIESNHIRFSVEDIMLKSYISSIMKKKGKTCDSSFEQEIIVIRTEDYEILITELYGEKETAKYLKDIQKKINNDKATWADILKQIAISTVVNIVPNVIINLIK